ncbi:MAG: hypothetical protein ACON4S_02270 [Porticoccaceae bacterium]
MKQNYDREVDTKALNIRRGEMSKTRSADEVEEILKQIIRCCLLESAKFCLVVNEGEINNFLNNKNSEFNSLLDRINAELFNGHGSNQKCRNIVEDYSELRRICRELTNITKQESDLDSSNRYRFLIFRFLTGLSFALTILLVSCFANYFRIPVPLSNMMSTGMGM